MSISVTRKIECDFIFVFLIKWVEDFGMHCSRNIGILIFNQENAVLRLCYKRKHRSQQWFNLSTGKVFGFQRSQ